MIGLATILINSLFWASLVLAPVESHAADPYYFRMDQPPGSMSKVLVRDQGSNYGDCYAATAAEMIDAYRFSHGDTKANMQTSALKLAVDYQKTFSDYNGTYNSNHSDTCDVINGTRWKQTCNDLALKNKNGAAIEAIMKPYVAQQSTIASIYSFQNQLRDLIQRVQGNVRAKLNPEPKSANGTCTISPSFAVPFSDFSTWGNEITSMEELSRGVTDLSKNFLAEIQENKKLYGQMKAEQEQKSEEFSKRILADLKSQGFDPRKLPTLLALEKSAKSGKSVDLLSAVMNGTCQPPNLISLPLFMSKCNDELLIPNANPSFTPGKLPANCAAIEAEQIKKTEAFINNKLSTNNQTPLEANICSQVLHAGKSYNGHLAEWGESNCTLHSVLVIGRRKNPKTGKLDFLIRNSWGTSCYGYSKDWDCEKDMGALWIDADTFSNSTTSAEWYEK